VEPAEAIDPAQKTVEVGQTRENQGFSGTLDRVEFGEDTTRAHLTLSNGTGSNASFFTHNAKIIQGARQIDPESPPQYDLPKLQSDLSPGVQAEGTIAFGPVDASAPFTVTLDWSSRAPGVRAQPLVFEVSP